MLLVGDNPAAVYFIQRAAQEYNSEIRLWMPRDEAEVLTLLRKDSPLSSVALPTLILLALRLPRMAGPEILTTSREKPAYWSALIIAQRPSRTLLFRPAPRRIKYEPQPAVSPE